MEENQALNTETTSEQTEVVSETQPNDVKTFTQEDLDRIVTKRLEREAKKWEAKFNALEDVTAEDKEEGKIKWRKFI